MRALPWRQRPHSCLESMGLWADTRTRPIYRKGLRPQGLGLPYFFSPAPNRSPGPRAPLLLNADSRKNGNAGFPEKENRPISWGPGGKAPGVSLRPFSTRRKDVAAHSISFSVGSRFLCAGILKTFFSAHAIKHRLCFGTPFLGDKTGGKEPPGGFPPWTPGWFCRFSLYENRLERRHPNRPK